MPEPVIKACNLSKCYRIGAVEKAYKTLREAIMESIMVPVRNFGRLRRLTEFKNGNEEDVLWALKDISFEVYGGEVLGIIGRNGAGKTTILKILSRITEPTNGFAEVRGRVSSLLEVGTGFHPELTGRENVFLNGAVLGMRKKEIEHKFDEIIDFAEIEKFIDTPIKRYSSGMQVRLAFSIAAHLEPEILLIDEVLAVGDIAFQKKCLGRMEDVAKGGRTVIFVSHNMGAIQSLCSSALWLDNGRIVEKGTADEVVAHYQNKLLRSLDESACVAERKPEEIGNLVFHFSRVEIQNMLGENTNTFNYGDKLVLIADLRGEPETDFSPEFRIYNELGQLVTTGAYAAFHGRYFSSRTKRIRIEVGPLPLTSGRYIISLSIMLRHRRCDTWENAIGFIINTCQPFKKPYEMPTHIEGACVIDHSFSETN